MVENHPIRRKNERGHAVVELALCVTILLAIMFWLAHFWEAQNLKLQTREAVRYLAWERTAFAGKSCKTRPKKPEADLVKEIQNPADYRFFAGYLMKKGKGFSVEAKVKENRSVGFVQVPDLLLDLLNAYFSLVRLIPELDQLIDLNWLTAPNYGGKGLLGFLGLIELGNAIDIAGYGFGLDLYPKGKIKAEVSVALNSKARLIPPVFLSYYGRSVYEPVSLAFQERYELEVEDWMAPDLDTMKAISKKSWVGQPLKLVQQIERIQGVKFVMGNQLKSLGYPPIDGRDIPGNTEKYPQQK